MQTQAPRRTQKMPLQPDDYLAPTGRLIIGNTLDASKRRIEAALKFYDPQLYLKWNPAKRGGWGMWEVRRTPSELTKVYRGHVAGQALYSLERKENDLIHHVLDVAVLHDGLIGKIKSMDTWGVKDWVGQADAAAFAYQTNEKRKVKEELQYNVKQHKREWKELAMAVSQGANPAELLKGLRIK
jgi:hypothetical protein